MKGRFVEANAQQLLSINSEIFQTEVELERAKLMRRWVRLAYVLLPAAFGLGYVANWLAYGRIDLLPVNVVLVPFVFALVVAIVAYLGSEMMPIWQIELNLSVLRERKRLLASTLQLTLHQMQTAYKDDAEREIGILRSASARYRRIHNAFQSIIIVGSLATTAVASLSFGAIDTRWAAVALSFSVGISAGFTGYFKFRERSYYLQVTADAVEQELTAFELGIGRFRNRAPEEALSEFVTEVHRLRNEQKQREQNLDQPSDEGTE